MKHLPSTKQLQYLLALHDYKSFSKAAEKCFVTQSTLSAGIASLEDILMQPLVDRSYRKVVFTPLGAEIIDMAREALKVIDDMVLRSAQVSGPLSGPLRLGMIPTIAPYLLPLILTPFQKEFPELEIQVHEEQSQQVVADVKNGHLDCAIMAFPYDTEKLERYGLFHEKFCIAAPQGHWAGHKPAKYEDIVSEKLLLLEDGHCLRDHALDACRIPQPQTQETLSATSLPTLIQMVRHGYGITLLPEMATHNQSDLQDMELIPLTKDTPGREIGMIWRDCHIRRDDFATIGDFIRQIHEDALAA